MTTNAEELRKAIQDINMAISKAEDEAHRVILVEHLKALCELELKCWEKPGFFARMFSRKKK
jgi:hypothetical protein